MASSPPLVLLLCSCFALLAACEPRVDELAQPDRATGAAQEQQIDPASPHKQSTPKLTKCMKPLGEKPKRVVIGEVPNPDCPADDLETPPVLGRGKVTFETEHKKTVSVEIAKQDPHRQRGLMFRKSMPEDEGMLFIFEETKPLGFWMHNTCIPLDMIFVGADGTIVGIEENTPTLSDDTFSSGCSARFVIEMNAGWARKNGVQAGQRVRLPL